MHIERLEITNVGPFREVTWSLPPTGVVLVVGPNNVGKSRLLRCVAALAGQGPVKRAGEIAQNLGWGVRGHFMVTDSERYQHTRIDGIEAQPALSRIEVLSRENVSIMATDHGGQLREHSGLSDPYRQALVTLYGDWANKVFSFAVHRAGTQATRPAQFDAQLSGDGQNLANVLLWLRSNDDPRWDELKRIMVELVPSVGDLRLLADQQNVQAGFLGTWSSSSFVNLKDLGTGVEQLLLSCTAALVSGAGAMILCEEPEAYLHPASQRAWLDHVGTWSRDRLFVIATHSPVFLDHEAVSETWTVEPQDGGTSTLRRLDSTERGRALTLLGVRLSDVLAAERVLLLESEEDRAVIDVWFPEWLRRNRVAAAIAGGRTMSGHMERLRGIFEGTDHLPRDVCMLCDRDEMNPEDVARAESQRVFVLHCRELENLLLSPSALAQLFSAESGITVEDEAVERELHEIAEKLRTTTILKRVVREAFPALHRARFELERSAMEADVPDALALEQAVTTLAERLTGQATGMGSLWQGKSVEVDQEWNSRWREIVPGADVLDRLFRLHGLKFDKRRHVPELARMIPPPVEFKEVLDRVVASFLSPQGRAAMTREA